MMAAMAAGVLLARAQFAFTIGFHILWPAYTIGVSGFIVIVDILWLATKRPVYRDLLRFWIHLFALGFAMGVVTGVVLSYGGRRTQRAPTRLPPRQVSATRTEREAGCQATVCTPPGRAIRHEVAFERYKDRSNNPNPATQS